MTSGVEERKIALRTGFRCSAYLDDDDRGDTTGAATSPRFAKDEGEISRHMSSPPDSLASVVLKRTMDVVEVYVQRCLNVCETKPYMLDHEPKLFIRRR